MTNLRHVLSSDQFAPQFLIKLFKRTDFLISQFKNSTGRIWLRQRLPHQLLFNIFYEPSTRTRMSFAAAAHHMGMNVVETENAKEFSSAIKGETLEDSIRVLCQYYPNVIILRHSQDGAAVRAANVSSVPIINAGDGKWQHPTQALLDVYTIFNKLKTLNNLTIVIGGDLAYSRTARSLIDIMSKFAGTKFVLISPPELTVFKDIRETLEKYQVPYLEIKDNSPNSIKNAFGQADVVYWTRLQKERIAPEFLEKISNLFTITTNYVNLMKPQAILMHPLPRNEEISVEVDKDPRAVYFEQPGNGMFVRMALLEWVLGLQNFS